MKRAPEAVLVVLAAWTLAGCRPEPTPPTNPDPEPAEAKPALAPGTCNTDADCTEGRACLDRRCVSTSAQSSAGACGLAPITFPDASRQLPEAAQVRIDEALPCLREAIAEGATLELHVLDADPLASERAAVLRAFLDQRELGEVELQRGSPNEGEPARLELRFR